MLIRALLLIEHERERTRLRGVLTELGALVSEEDNPEELWNRLGQETHDLILLSSSALPDEPETSISEIRNLPSRPEVIVLVDTSGQGRRASLQSGGAFAVIDRELDLVSLSETLEAVLSRYREIGLSRFSEEQRQQSKLEDFSSRSTAMKRLLELARRVSASDTSLLILGETGVGKEWLARAIHSEGPRSAAPFVAVNCAAVPETLLESELFGHEKGAFTGATRARRGCFEMAHRGTLFLDELADLPIHLQVKLLRAIQEKTIQRLGAETPVQVDVRLMAATNQDLEDLMGSGNFRRDLYYRLSVVTLTVPPLRDRRADIVPLVENYLAEYRKQLGRFDIDGITELALEHMRAYEWPGNVRELINVVERAVLLCDDRVIDLEHLPDSFIPAEAGRTGLRYASSTQPGESLLSRSLEEGKRELMERYERDYLLQALKKTRGNIGETARIAGVDPRTVYNKMKALGLRKEDFRRTSDVDRS